MSDTAIRVEGLGKRYRIGARRERYKALRDTLADAAAMPFRALRSLGKREPGGRETEDDSIWALKDVSFEVKSGEVVGVIGRNGAGKSTLLKILSRITEPTEGRISIHGRIGSLLEVGTGFHPELTGRENIYLNGAILGMRRAEIERKFDEIVAFAEIEKFLDTPVKRYSSGMHMRLAFSVAAHLEPEILLVDEVLAVGDAQFQKKCLGQMSRVARQGLTVILVSHNMAALRNICGSAILLHQGRLAAAGPCSEVLAGYEKSFEGAASGPPGLLYEAPPGNADFQILRIEMLDALGRRKPRLATWDAFRLRIQFQSRRPSSKLSAVLRFSTGDGYCVLLTSSQPDHDVELTGNTGITCVDCAFDRWPFAGGRLVLAAGLAIPNSEWLTPLEDLAVIETEGANVFGSRSLVPTMGRTMVVPVHSWHPVAPSAEDQEDEFSCRRR